MKKVLLLVLATVTLFSFSQCSKEGSEGPRGEKGIQGEKGDPGKDGIDGIDGIDGNTIFSGNGSPASSLGQSGDLYIDLSNNELYGPKDENGWGGGIDLVGDKGPKGDRGPRGKTGPKGPKGDKGDRGPRGETGPKGPKGDKGDRGPRGPKGDKGAKGDDGSKIYSGELGYELRIVNGVLTSVPIEPDKETGEIGDYFLDSKTGVLWGPKVLVVGGANGWTNNIKLKGEKGDKGTANVIYSEWAEPWRWQGGGDWQLGFLGSYLTQDQMDYGVILVYKREEPNSETFHPTIALLPTTSEDVKYSFYIYEHDPVIAIEVEHLSGGTIPDNKYKAPAVQFRYVIIPGGIPARRSEPAPDFNDYEAVCEFYGIPK